MTATQIKTARTHGVTSVSQYATLGYLLDHDKTTTGTLGEHLCTSAANITGIIDNLKSNGLVARSRSRTDRRCIFISLTSLGQDIARQLHPTPALA